MPDSNTPGIYIDEKNGFPSSAIAVETAVPVFIGYTQKAMRYGKSLLYVPTKISSVTEYIALFGEAFNPTFKIIEAASSTTGETFLLNGKKMQAAINDNNSFYFYHCIRFFYGNGGGNCYILSVGTYGDNPAGFEIDLSDFTGNKNKPNVFGILEKETEPTLIVLADVIAKGVAAYPLYQLALEHCAKMQNRFAIFDVWQSGTQTIDEAIQQFRDGIGNEFLYYGAAYYPWLKTSVIEDSEIDFTNLDIAVDLAGLLPETADKNIVADIKKLTPEELEEKRAAIQLSLVTCSPAYVNIMQAIKAKLSLLPPAAAMAGIYTLVDNTKGVWNAPANVAVAMVTEPAVSISDEQQQTINVDAPGGKSINVIRLFHGPGTMVWGARTLDGNSEDWRYINVCRTVIMIEQSLKRAALNYVFEPNDRNTWAAMKGMMDGFLAGVWAHGALAGAKPGDAFNVQIGLGATMTSDDIINGVIRIAVQVAISHPAEFIVIGFEQQQQK